ncbi:C4-dicarboxylate TRAP transporter large permease protein DctM [bioreactor metagenome]|uniref:C4-dicarboxylate TRAP transporter large permease protein DctM n=1 Tax=bioreactor metagenome TaxID=1076179 RepID=A0A645CEY1_9ZZZZ
MAIGVPIAFSLAVSSFLYLALNGMVLSLVAQKMTISLDSFVFIALPLFILAGEIMNTGRLTQRLVNLAKVLVGRFKGGLAHVNVVVSMLFGGVQGLATADTVAIGSILIPAMEKDGYRKDFSTAITVASSTLGAIIPPSLLFVIFGSVTNVSIGKLFLGGIIPGILLGLAQMAYVVYLGKSHRHRDEIPAGQKLDKATRNMYIREGLPTVLLPIIIIGGIFSGVVTATEAASIAVVYAVVVGLLTRELRLADLPGIFWRSAKTVGSVMIILAASSIFGYILTQEQVPQMAVNLLLGITDNKYLLLLIINLFLLFVGTFMDSTPAVIILAPILLPVLTALGMDPVHIGVFMCFNLIQGLITPPVGSCLYLASGISHLTVEQISKAMIPFYTIALVVLLLVTYIPQTVLVLARLLGSS